MDHRDEPPHLRRSLNLWETALGGVGMILGAGIYALIGAAAAEAGSGIWLSFLIAAGFAAIVGLCYAELASMFPRAGADYEYAYQALGERTAFVVGWVVALGNILAAAAVSVAFASYFAEFVNTNSTLTALVALIVAAIIASVGIKESVRLVVAATLVEVAGLLIIIGIGLPHLPSVNLAEMEHGWLGVLAGTSLVMFAFNGFAQIATLGEEAVDASRVIPRAMLLAVGITAVLYVSVAVSAVAVLGPASLASSDTPLTTVASRVLGTNAGRVIALIALFSTGNTMLLHLIVGSRMVYGMAAARAMPGLLAWIHPRRETPVPAIVLAVAVAGLFALSGRLSFIAGATNFTIFVGISSVCISLIILRRTRPDQTRPFRVPISFKGVPMIPLAGLVLTVLLTSTLEANSVLVGFGLLLAGVAAMALRRSSREQTANLEQPL